MDRHDHGRAFTVVAAVMRDATGRVLLARRPPGSHMAGLWEFPGGKIAAGESPAAALVRELVEELGVTAEIGRPITFAIHEEPGLRILLLFYEAQIVAGRPSPLEGQELGWFEIHRLRELSMPPADLDLVERLTLDLGPRRPLP